MTGEPMRIPLTAAMRARFKWYGELTAALIHKHGDPEAIVRLKPGVTEALFAIVAQHCVERESLPPIQTWTVEVTAENDALLITLPPEDVEFERPSAAEAVERMTELPPVDPLIALLIATPAHVAPKGEHFSELVH